MSLCNGRCFEARLSALPSAAVHVPARAGCVVTNALHIILMSSPDYRSHCRSSPHPMSPPRRLRHGKRCACSSAYIDDSTQLGCAVGNHFETCCPGHIMRSCAVVCLRSTLPSWIVVHKWIPNRFLHNLRAVEFHVDDKSTRLYRATHCLMSFTKITHRCPSNFHPTSVTPWPLPVCARLASAGFPCCSACSGMSRPRWHLRWHRGLPLQTPPGVPILAPSAFH